MTDLFLISLLMIQLPYSVLNLSIQSTEEKSCKVTTDKGKVDLSPLASSTSFKFQKQDGKLNDIKYFWNPCNNFDIPAQGECRNVEVCQQYGRYTNSYGTKDESEFVTSGDNLILTYHHFRDSYNVWIQLECDTSEQDEFKLGPTAELVLNWTLTSRHACYIQGQSVLSVGSILCIIAVALIAAYIIAGVLCNKFAKKASGRELCPNYSFWNKLPGLVKDGLIYTFWWCKLKDDEASKPTTSYDSI